MSADAHCGTVRVRHMSDRWWRPRITLMWMGLVDQRTGMHGNEGGTLDAHEDREVQAIESPTTIAPVALVWGLRNIFRNVITGFTAGLLGAYLIGMILHAGAGVELPFWEFPAVLITAFVAILIALNIVAGVLTTYEITDEELIEHGGVPWRDTVTVDASTITFVNEHPVWIVSRFLDIGTVEVQTKGRALSELNLTAIRRPNDVATTIRAIRDMHDE